MLAKISLLELDSKTAMLSSAAGCADAKLVRERIDALRAAASESGSAYIRVESDSDSAFAELAGENYVALCGRAFADELYYVCLRLKESGVWPLIVCDAFENNRELSQCFDRLELNHFQLAKTQGIVSMLRGGGRFVFPFAKPDCSSTLCLLFDNGEKALVIERLAEPYKGCLAFPGGFLRVQLESMEDCALREMEEECSVNLKPSELRLVDLRSAPGRDPRTHVVDAGYAWLFSDERKLEILSELKAGDDAASAQLCDVRDLLMEGRLAFDHRELLLNSLKSFNLI